MADAVLANGATLGDRTPAVEPRVPFKVKLCYGIGDLGSGLMNGGSAYVVFFYNQVLGLPAFWVTVAMFGGLAIDAFVDTIAGGLSDATKSRWGRRHPYIVLSAVPIALTFYLTFSVPDGLPHWALMGWMIVMTALWRISSSFFLVPYWALGSELSKDFHERTIVGAYRIFFAFAGTSAAALMGVVFFGGAGGAEREGQFEVAPYHTIATIIAITVICVAWTSAVGTRSVIPRLTKAAAKFSIGGLFKEIGGFLHNRPFCVFFAGAFMFSIVLTTYSVASIYFGTYFWAFSTRQIFLMPSIGIAGMAAGTFAWPAISRRIGKKYSYMAGAAGFCALLVLPIFLKTGGVFIDHDSSVYFPVLALINFLAYLSGSAGAVIAASMLPDVIENYAAGRPEKSVAGLITGMLNFNVKVALGVSNVIMGGVLSFVGLGHKTGIAVPPAVVHRLGLTYAPVVIAAGAICLAIFSFYSIPDKKWARPKP
jgi:Na+/melibiose symporter-like transporter